MQLLVIAIGCTLGISFFCSLLEAMVLSTSVADIQNLKKRSPRRGEMLETLKVSLDQTISAILTLNTVANTLGSVIIGGLATKLFGDAVLGMVSALLTLAILIFSEVLPKNLGVVHRRALQPHAVYPLWWIRRVLAPVTYLCGAIVRWIVPPRDEAPADDEEIILLAERGAQQGTLTKNESSIIANALSLDDVRVSEIMTPRIVVTALRRNATVAEVFREFPNLPFGRMPVYGETLDEIVGLVRRRDLQNAKAHDRDTETVEKLMREIHFIPDTVTAGNALQVFLRHHQQMLVVVDEFGTTAGVLTMEDVIEHILGREIFEKDDPAVDMRELARAKQKKQAGETMGTANPSKPKPN
ncbi:MAG: HlyC/CorC family transporter [Opitutaceae bacterium]|nr:HlyC/CorC family transporter [Opitutaceae bacterium]